ncbi:MAG TPA: serine--tRNA ligase [Methanosarcinales archaeon]|nr:serine--tRNA ligase [Methanosarcinales archaeon]
MELQFRIKGKFRTSADPAPARQEILDMLKNAQSTILSKGAPEGMGAGITSMDVDVDGVALEITSGRYVRAHDAILRLRKPLAELLGKGHRIGVRGLEISEYVVRIPSEQPLKEFKLPYVSSMEYANGALILSLELGQSEIENRVPDRIISLVEDKVKAQSYGGKGEHWNLLWESGKKEHVFDSDPTGELMKRGWIKRGASRGQWIHGPQSVAVFRAFERIVMEEIVKPLGYREMIFPKLVTWDVWQRSGHAKGVYPEIYYVCPPKTRDPEFWEEVADYYKVTLEVPLDMIAEKIDKPIGGLCYAQCPPFWPFLQGETMPDDGLPLYVFDRSGTSHRYESGGLHGMERVDEFHRIELVFIGTPEQVVAHSEDMQKRYMHIFNDILDLEWRTAWVTPWFMAQEGLAGLADETRVGTIDYEAVMPYRGEDGEWLEFQNMSVNGDKYPKGFNVKSQSYKELWSGCSGIGLERWASAFYAQKGLDADGWPEAFREIVGELPEGIRFL